MPAMSPTMTEGNITAWKIKEGKSFSAGDVLLEIETDKAQMDVEAQDDGIMARITQPDGSKGIKVGTRIGVLAEEGDDLGALDIPKEDAVPSPQEETKADVERQKSSESQAEASPSSHGSDASDAAPQPPSKPVSSSSKSIARPSKQSYPLCPSVFQLLRQNGIDLSEADKIPATGPKGRLLKGDVLTYLGSISSYRASELAESLQKLSILDLGNIKIAPPPKPATDAMKPAPSFTPDAEAEPETEVAVPISLKAVHEVQQRMKTALGVDMPLETFIARAVEIANFDLPRSKSKPATADELFSQVLGIKNAVSKTSDGAFVPQIIALPAIQPRSLIPQSPPRQPDILDILTGEKPKRRQMSSTPATTEDTQGPVNIFSVSVVKGDEKRGKVFLERMKTALQVDPGQLVL